MRREPRCPERQDLHHLLLGEVSDDRADLLEAHLAGCADCLQTMRQLKADDALVTALRTGTATMEAVLADENEALTTRLRGLRSAMETCRMPAQPVLAPAQGHDEREGLGASAPPPGRRLRLLAAAAVLLVTLGGTALMISRFLPCAADTSPDPVLPPKAADAHLPRREGERRVAFAGTVVTVDPRLADVFRFGQALSGAYTFRPDTAPRPGGTEKHATYDALTGLHFQLGDYSATSTGAPEIQIDNDLGDGNHDRYFVTARVQDGLRGRLVNGHGLLNFAFRLDDSRDAALTTALTLPTDLNLAEFDSRGFGLAFGDPAAPLHVGGKITSLSTQ